MAFLNVEHYSQASSTSATGDSCRKSCDRKMRLNLIVTPSIQLQKGFFLRRTCPERIDKAWITSSPRPGLFTYEAKHASYITKTFRTHVLLPNPASFLSPIPFSLSPWQRQLPAIKTPLQLQYAIRQTAETMEKMTVA